MPRKIWIKCACGHEGTKVVSIHANTTREHVFPRAICQACGQAAAVDMRVYWASNDSTHSEGHKLLGLTARPR